MLITNYLLPLLPLTSAISLHNLARRGHQTLALRLSSPESTPIAADKRSHLVTPKHGKAKRLVKKSVKRRACSAGNQPVGNNSTIGNGYVAPPPASSTTAAPAPSATPTSSSGWVMTDNWVSQGFFLNLRETRTGLISSVARQHFLRQFQLLELR